jgi:hypothetical protein
MRLELFIACFILSSCLIESNIDKLNIDIKKTSWEIGETGPAGGIIFYKSDKPFMIDGINGEFHYLEAAKQDVSKETFWGLKGTYTRETLMTFGSGYNNTNILIKYYIETWSAAVLCKEYRGGGKNDWFLPSYKELELMYKNIGNIGNFSDLSYWSSSEYSHLNARAQDFKTGYQSQAVLKTEKLCVRPIRVF